MTVLAVVTIVPSILALSASRVGMLWAILAGVVAAAALAWGRKRVAGMTLAAPCRWALVALACVVAVECLAASEGSSPWLATLHYLAAITTFAPPVAVLGAKRPQNKAWQWIVLSLLVVLALPSGEALVFGRGSPPSLHTARSWFLGVLIAVGALNYLPTRFWLAGLFYAAGQICLLANYLPGMPVPPSWLPLAGLSCGAATALLIVFAPSARSPDAKPLDQAWIDFRNAYGAVWGLRVQERVNAIARSENWPVRLSWHGVLPLATNSDAPVDLEPVRRNLHSLLRRFVSAEWLAAHEQQPEPEAS
jgi:hypothetical protein